MVWLLRSFGLLSAMLTSLPAWRGLDPLQHTETRFEPVDHRAGLAASALAFVSGAAGAA